MGTTDRKEQAVALRAAGHSVRDIGRRLGVSHMTAQRWTTARPPVAPPATPPIVTGLPAPPHDGGPVAAAAEAQDERGLLAAMRDRIAAAIDDPLTPVRDLSALSRRQIELLRELERLDAERPAHLTLVAGAPDDPDCAWDGSRI
jgi:Homeodomain-like domain